MEVRDKDLTRISSVKSTSEFVLKYTGSKSLRMLLERNKYYLCLQVSRMLLDEKDIADVPKIPDISANLTGSITN